MRKTVKQLTLNGSVIAAHGRHYLVQLDGPEREKLLCVTRGKKSDIAVGDEVEMARTSGNQGVIETILPRRTLLYRSDQYRSKLLAANLTQILIVVATEPSFSDDLVSRSLVAAEAAGITPWLVLNKIDIQAGYPSAMHRLNRYRSIGYPVLEMSSRTAPEHVLSTLLPILSGQSTILIGQSGMGKSSIINLLVPGADIAVREISAALDTGKHTTTFTKRYDLDDHSTLIDSPGFQEFGLYHLSEGMLERAFPEFRPQLGKCKFYNCHHDTEPACAVLEAMKEGLISPERHQLYLQLRHEASQTLY
jgi:ribosome biogenesis GTPase